MRVRIVRPGPIALTALLALGWAASGCGSHGVRPEETPTATPPTRSQTVTPLPTSPPQPDLLRPPAAEVRIGFVYPLSGRLGAWGREVRPFVEAAQADLDASAAATGIRFTILVRDSGTTPEGALAAVRDLVEHEGVQVIAGLPLSNELEASIGYLTQHQVAAISSASTSPLPDLGQPDTVFRLMLSERTLARRLGELAVHLGYVSAAIIYRDDAWGPRYAQEVAAVFEAQGYPAVQVPIEPTHPDVGDYASEVAQLSARLSELGVDERAVAILVVWEGEDLNILHHAAQDPILSRVRWLAAALYPSLLTGRFEDSDLTLPDARDFALGHSLWGQESYPPSSELLRRLLAQAEAQLGAPPRFEHVYAYDALLLAAKAAQAAESRTGGDIAAAIPLAAESYGAATGPIRFDSIGDRSSGDLAYYGLYLGDAGYEFRYYAFNLNGIFEVLSQPEPRGVRFCPEC